MEVVKGFSIASNHKSKQIHKLSKMYFMDFIILLFGVTILFLTCSGFTKCQNVESLKRDTQVQINT